MKIPRGLLLGILLMILGGVGYWNYREDSGLLPRWGTPASQRPTPPPGPAGLTEEQWTILEVCDQIVYLLRPELLKHAAAEKRITAQRDPFNPLSYTVEAGPAKSMVTVSTPVWDPATYQGWCAAVSDKTAAPGRAARQDILTELLTPGTETYLAIDARLSAELARQPRDPALCTDAALLLGTMAWLDGAGHFQDVRPLLNRMTAFLGVADALGASGPKREVAEMLRLVLINNQVAALAKITAARSSTEAIPPAWLDALEVRTTGDWRKTEPTAASAPLLLQLAHYRVLTLAMSTAMATTFLKSVKNPEGAEWVRFLTQMGLPIEDGHRFSRTLLGVEAEDINTVAEALGGGSTAKPKESFVSFVQKFDGTASYERPPETRVVGRQLWAGRAQRNLLQSMRVLHHFVAHQWGVPEHAAEFAAEMTKQFSPAYYFPFLTLEMEEAGSPLYQEALLAGDRLARQQPAMIAPKLWAALKPEAAAGVNRGSPDFHHFFNPELPRLTSFEAGKRIYEIGVGDENSLNLLQEILARCPYDFEMAFQTALVEGRPNNVEGKRMECCEQFADTSLKALRWVAADAAGNPQKFERLKVQEAKYNPNAYLGLANYFNDKGDIERGEKYLLLARNQVDSVSFANACDFLVQHYARTGRMKEAEDIAKEAADTYSGGGLEAYGWLKEYQGQWEEAARIYAAIDERYGGGNDSAVLGYALRRKAAGQGWDEKYQPMVEKVFPRGMEKISLATIGPAAPTSGVRFTTMSKALRETGIALQDVVVGLDGFRVETEEQYVAARSLTDSPDMLFLVWDEREYSEVKVRQPGRRFNTGLKTYQK